MAYETVIRNAVRHTPLYTSATIARIVGCDALHLKLENLQRTGSFKIRGATSRITALSDEERSRGVVAASAGNHAQGVAVACHDAGVACTVYMPRTASIAKIQATEGYGARVVLEGAAFDDAARAAADFADKTGAVYVSAFDDDGIITGQGSLGLELLEDLPDVDTVVIPIGGGGLFAGVSAAIKAARPNCRLIGVQAAGADTAARSFAAGRLLASASGVDTIADGIAVKTPSARTFAYIRRYADDVVTVSDERLADTILLLLTRVKIVVEPAGAAALAAIWDHPAICRGKTVAILSGGNINVRLLSDLIERGMIRAHRYFHFFTECRDKPGALAALLDAIAAHGGNVIEVTHNRISPGVPYGRTGVEILLEVRDEAHIAEISGALKASGHTVRRID